MHYVVPAIQHPFEGIDPSVKKGHSIVDGRNGRRKHTRPILLSKFEFLVLFYFTLIESVKICPESQND